MEIKKRAIIRAAMIIEDVVQIAAFSTTDSEEYGEFVYFFGQEDVGFFAELNEDGGGLEEFEGIEDCLKILAERRHSCGEEKIIQEINIAKKKILQYQSENPYL